MPRFRPHLLLRIRVYSRMLLNLVLYGRTTKPPYKFVKPPP